MTIYITTDTHFNHAKIFDYCDRPLDFQEKLKSGFSRLTEDDTLIHLGDICIGQDAAMHSEFIVPIKAKKILIRGNHDKKSAFWYESNGWDFVCNSMESMYFGVKVLFSHKPRAWDGIFDINIHGHLHDLGHRPGERGTRINHLISLEFMGYELISLKSILEPIKAAMNEYKLDQKFTQYNANDLPVNLHAQELMG